jgi:hypothetical protein
VTDDQLSLDEELETWEEWFADTLNSDLNPQLTPTPLPDPLGDWRHERGQLQPGQPC